MDAQGRPIEGAIFNQEQARFGVSNGVFAIAIGMVGPTLLAHGTDDQKKIEQGERVTGGE